MSELQKELKKAGIDIFGWTLDEEENILSITVNIPDDIFTIDCSCDVDPLLCPIHDKESAIEVVENLLNHAEPEGN